MVTRRPDPMSAARTPPTDRQGARPPAQASGESGYTMVALAVAVAILSIMVGAAMPMWSTIVQREKEAELIFRGWQYAEAIRVFQQRHGRLPTRLGELIKVKPRSIRKLWEDPMTEDGKWGLVFQGQQGGQVRGRDLTQVGGSGGDRRTGPQGRGRGGGNRPGGDGRPGGPGGFGDPEDGETRQTGPIVGVHSRSTDESIKTLFGERQYDRWTFTVDRLNQGNNRTQVGVGADVRAALGITPARWIGRPFREGLRPEQGRGPGGPGGPRRPGGPNRPGPNGRGPGGPGSNDAGRSGFSSEGPDR